MNKTIITGLTDRPSSLIHSKSHVGLANRQKKTEQLRIFASLKSSGLVLDSLQPCKIRGQEHKMYNYLFFQRPHFTKCTGLALRTRVMQTGLISLSLLISSHPLVRPASQKADIHAPLIPLSLLHFISIPQPDKTESERGRFLAVLLQCSYPEARKKKERGGGLVGG